MATINSIVWNPTIYDCTNAIPLDVADRCIKLMLATSVVAQRDFAKFGATDLVNQVAYVNPNSNVNYIKIRTGRDSSSPAANIDVILLYHYLNHRKAYAPNVGFSPSLVPHVSPSSPGVGEVDDPTYPYVILARAVTSQIRADLLSFTTTRPLIAYIYDDIDKVDPTGKQASRRRVTPIGELGWVAQHNADINSFMTFNTVVETVPFTANRLWIPPGYYRPGDTQVATTTLTIQS